MFLLRAISTAFFLSILVFLAGCGREWTWHQKLTVEVIVEGEIITGSAVSAVRIVEDSFASTERASFKGQATVIDLGTRGKLFALLQRPDLVAAYTFSTIARPVNLGRVSIRTNAQWDGIAAFRGSRQIPSTFTFPGQGSKKVPNTPRRVYPTLVTFTDITNPATLKEVDPANLAASFGPGVRLSRMILEVTDEPVTNGSIATILPCLKTGEPCFRKENISPASERLRYLSNNAFWTKCGFFGC